MNTMQREEYEYEPIIPSTLTVAQAATLLSVTPQTVRNMCKRGEFKAFNIGGLWRIPTSFFMTKYQLTAPDIMRCL